MKITDIVAAVAWNDHDNAVPVHNLQHLLQAARYPGDVPVQLTLPLDAVKHLVPSKELATHALNHRYVVPALATVEDNTIQWVVNVLQAVLQVRVSVTADKTVPAGEVHLLAASGAKDYVIRLRYL